MKLEVVVDIAAAPERVWAVLSDVERWPEWTASMSSVRLGEGRALGPDSIAHIKQPRLPAATFRVTSFDAGRGFVWETRSLGATSVAAHRIDPINDGSRVTLTIRMTGGLTPLFAPLTSRFVRRYMNMEAQGLKHRSEAEAMRESGSASA